MPLLGRHAPVAIPELLAAVQEVPDLRRAVVVKAPGCRQRVVERRRTGARTAGNLSPAALTAGPDDDRGRLESAAGGVVGDGVVAAVGHRIDRPVVFRDVGRLNRFVAGFERVDLGVYLVALRMRLKEDMPTAGEDLRIVVIDLSRVGLRGKDRK